MNEHGVNECILLNVRPLSEENNERKSPEESAGYGSTARDVPEKEPEYIPGIVSHKSTEPDLYGKSTTNGAADREEGTAQVELSFRAKVLRTVALNMAYITVTLGLGLLGPSLIDLGILTGASEKQLSTIFTARGILAIIGSLVLGPLFDKINRYLIIAVALFLNFLFMAAVPLCRNLASLLVVISPPEFFGGAIGMGTHLVCIDLWGEGSGPGLQLLNLISVVGFTLAPLLAKPFLAPDVADRDSGIADNGHSQPGGLAVSPQITIVNINHEANSIPSWTPKDGSYIHITDDTDLKFSPKHDANSTVFSAEQQETIIQYAFLMIGIYSLMISIFFVVIFCLDKCKFRLTENVIEEEHNPKMKNSKSFKIKVSVLFFFFNVFYSGIEVGYAGQLMNFAKNYLGWKKDSGAYVTASLQGANALVTAAAIIFSRCIRPAYILTVDIILVILSLLVLALTVSKYHVLLWVCSILLGAGYATIMPSTFTWANSFMEVTGTFSSAYWCGFFSGFMAIPALTGYLMDEVNPMWFPYMMVMSAACMGITFTILCVIVHRRNVRFEKDKTEEDSSIIITAL